MTDKLAQTINNQLATQNWIQKRFKISAGLFFITVLLIITSMIPAAFAAEQAHITVHANQVTITQGPDAKAQKQKPAKRKKAKTQKQAGKVGAPVKAAAAKNVQQKPVPAPIDYSNTVSQTPDSVLVASNEYDFSKSDLNTPLSTMDLPKSNDSKIQKLTGSWSAWIAAYQFQDETSKKSISELNVQINAEYQANSYLRISLWPAFSSETGNAQNRNQEEANSSAFSVKQAAVFAGTENVEAGFGALNQRPAVGRLLIKNTAFPAVSLKLQTNSTATQVVQVGVSGEAAIPTSVNLATENQTFEKTPTFSNAKVFLKLQSDMIEGGLSAGYWEYKNLPSSVAKKSSANGNTIDSLSNTADLSAFAYQYKGYFANADTTLHLSNYFDTGITANYVRNNSAPNKLNQGYRLRSFATINFSDEFSSGPYYEFYRIEPDTVVAAYGTDSLMPNTTGYKAGLELKFSKSFTLAFSGGEQIALYESPTQTRQRVYEISLETVDVSF
jgi:hypothetical protein